MRTDNAATDSASGFLTPPVVPYSVASETLATRPSELSQDAATEIGARWEKVIDEQLIEWANHPEEFVEEGLTPPSHETIRLAIQHVAQRFKNQRLTPPSQVVPDANGGVVFERRDSDVFESIRVQADGHIEYCRFCGGRLVERQSWR